MKKSIGMICVSVLLFLMSSSTIVLSAGLLPSHSSTDYCPSRYLSGEELEFADVLVDMGTPYDPFGFPKLEREAAADIENWDGPGSPMAILVLLEELKKRGMAGSENPPSLICGYDAVTFKSLLWLATKIIWKKQERGPIMPHTFQAEADTRIDDIWVDGFKKGLYGLPVDEKIAECWQKNNATDGQKCMDMRPDIVADLNRRIAEFELK
jgi:hypothetical protein